jgi:osmotically-inducible protein OsmY
MTTTGRTDGEIHSRVLGRLMETPTVTARVRVSVRAGVVTLCGTVANSSDHVATRQAAMRIQGVVGVADKMEVRAVGAGSGLAATANEVLKVAGGGSVSTVTASVRGNVLTLSGTVTAPGHRDAAVRAVRHLRGVVGISNDIVVTGDGSSGSC